MSKLRANWVRAPASAAGNRIRHARRFDDAADVQQRESLGSSVVCAHGGALLVVLVRPFYAGAHS